MLVSASSPPVAYGGRFCDNDVPRLADACSFHRGGRAESARRELVHYDSQCQLQRPSQPVPSATASSLCVSGQPEPEEIERRKLRVQPERPVGAILDERPYPPLPYLEQLDARHRVPPGYSVPYTLDQRDNATKAVTSLGLQCSAQVTTTTTLPPPSPSEAWAASIKVLPLPQIRFSPSSSGLVHLETWFWLSNDAAGVPVTVTATAGGTRLLQRSSQCHIPGRLVHQRQLSNLYGGLCGQWRDASATTYTYLDAGTYEVSVTVGWAGSFGLEGKTYDIASPADPVDGPATFAPYEVQRNTLSPDRGSRMSTGERDRAPASGVCQEWPLGGSLTCPMLTMSFRSRLAGLWSGWHCCQRSAGVAGERMSQGQPFAA